MNNNLYNKENLYHAFHNIQPNEMQKNKMLNNILNHNEQGEMKMKKSKPMIALASVMCAFLISTTALAIAYQLDSGFFAFLKPTDEQAQSLATGAYEVNKTISNKNGDLEIKQVLGDEHTTYILMDFTAPEGTILDGEDYTFDLMESDVLIDDYNLSYGHQFTNIADDNPTDNKISFILYIKSEHSLANHNISLKLENLCDNYETPVITGKWKISFPLNFTNISTSYDINRNFNINNENITLGKFTVSPISLNLYFPKDVNSGLDIDIFHNMPVTLVFADGSTFTATDENSNRFTLGKATEITTTLCFNQVIDIAKLKSIIIFDQEINLK